jgi:hypothetical protein
LQPEDWDDKEYIPDPEDKKPEVVFYFLALYAHVSLILLNSTVHCLLPLLSRAMMIFPRKFLTLMLRRYFYVVICYVVYVIQ